MIIRPCKKKDLSYCYDLCNIPELFYVNGGNFTIYHLKQHLSKKYFLVAEKNSKIIGLIFGEKLKAGGSLVWAIVVHKDFRGKKIGTKLLNAFEENAKKDDCHWIILFSTTKNKKALNFYKKQKYIIGQNVVECAKYWRKII